MSNYESLIAGLNAADTVVLKTQLVDYIGSALEKEKPSKKDRDMLTTAIEHEFVFLNSKFDKTAPYRIKNDMIGYANSLMALALFLYNTPDVMPQSLLAAVMQFLPTLKSERYLENEIDEIFEKDSISPALILHLSDTLDGITDEFQRGLFWSGLLHYTEAIENLPTDTADALHTLMVRELTRLIALPITEDTTSSLEIACDAASLSQGNDIIALLFQVLTHTDNGVVFYAASSLLKTNTALPDETVARLATDSEYAALLYQDMKKAGLSECFPSTYATPEYLAESDLVHWLTYPTELGQKPDEIKLLGTVTVEKTPYYIFIYRSDSDTLGEDLQNRWLIGWSAENGNTFSNFDLYADYEEKTVEKTLKKIKKELLY